MRLVQAQPCLWSSLPRAHYWTVCIGPNGTTTRAWAMAPTPSSIMRTCCWGFQGCGNWGSAMTPVWYMRTSERTLWAAMTSTLRTKKSSSPLGPSMAQREFPHQYYRACPSGPDTMPRFGNHFHRAIGKSRGWALGYSEKWGGGFLWVPTLAVWRLWSESFRNREGTLADWTLASGLVSTYRS